MFSIYKGGELVDKKRAEKFIRYFSKGDNWHHLNLKSGGLGYGWIHYSLIRLLKPDRVLCVGSKWGLIPAICALACKDNKKGKVDFVDAGYDISKNQGPGKHWGGVGFWKKCNPVRYFGKFGLQNYINLYVMTSKEYFETHKRASYGYVHIDGDHSYKGVKFDFEMSLPKVKTGGFLAIHDIGSPDKDGNLYGTRKFWREIQKISKNNFLEINEDPGIGIIQKA